MNRTRSRTRRRAACLAASGGRSASAGGLAAVVAVAAILLIPRIAAAASAPYPASTAIPGIAFDWGTHRRLAPGSDNWPLTWSADGDQYTSFGDGGGFGGTSSRGRVSLGFAKVEGSAGGYQGGNVWGGVNAETSAKFGGKSYGVLAIGADLYMWRCGGGSNNTAYDFQKLYKSTDDGVTWRPANWEFPESLTFYCPTFVQFGRGYAGARDDYVYMHAPERDNNVWEVHEPGRITLMRAPKDRLMDRSAYEFFAGPGNAGQPRWSAAAADRRPVFSDPNGARLVSVAYNAGLGRYLLATEHAPKGSSNIGIFDAPTPWGPWTTVLYQDAWGRGEVETSGFYFNFAPKWWSNGGRDFVLVFTGSESLDSWNSVEGSFAVGSSRSGAAVAGAGTVTTEKEDEPATTTAPAAGATAGAATSRSARAPRVAGASLRATGAATSAVASSARSPRRTIFTSTAGSSSAVAGADLPAASTATPASRAVGSGGRVAVSGAGPTVAAGLSSSQRRVQAGPSEPDRTRSASTTTGGSTAAAAGTETDAAQGVDAAGATGSGRQARRVVTSSDGSADRTRDTATATGSRTAATSGATAPSAATSGAASPSATAAAAAAASSAVASTEARGADADGATADPEPEVGDDTLAAIDAPASPNGAPANGRPSSGDPRLVGVLELGTARMALVVPPGASQPVTVRIGDRLGLWSVTSVDGEEVALRSGEQTMVLRLFAGGGRTVAGDAG